MTSRRHRPYVGPALFHLRLVPSPLDLRAEPHLASLALLQIAADIAAGALLAIYANVESSNEDQSGELRIARELVDLARSIAITSERYRRVLKDTRSRSEDDLPF